MADDKIVKPPSPEDEKLKGMTTTGGTVKITGKSRLHSALAQAPQEDSAESFRKAAAAARGASLDKRDALTAENRIAIMADVSGSMDDFVGGKMRKIDHLKAALTGFNNHVNFDTTAIAIYTFPLEGDDYEDYGHEENPLLPGGTVSNRLSFDKFLLDMTIQGLHTKGSTPMAETMEKVINELPLTRGIIISDGDADSASRALEIAQHYAESKTIIDTVHIGNSGSGEELLARIASMTGGIYIKFSDVGSFAKSFAFLTPEGRATLALTAGPNATLEQKQATAKMLGAREIK